MMKYIILNLMLCVFLGQSKAQETLQLNGESSPKASLDDIAWLAGDWRGQAFGGEIQEVWLPPLGDSMMCAFKLVKNGKVEFYEFCQIREENSSLIIRLKHFNGDLTSWEEKNETVDFHLVKLTTSTAYFEGFTIKKINPNQINMYVLIGEGGKESEVEFNYYRNTRK